MKEVSVLLEPDEAGGYCGQANRCVMNLAHNLARISWS